MLGLTESSIIKPEVFLSIRQVDLEKLYEFGHDFVDLDGESIRYVDRVYDFMSQINFEGEIADTSGLYGPDGSPTSVPRCISYDYFENTPEPIRSFWSYIHDSELLSHFRRRGSFKMETSLVRYSKGHGLAPHNDLQGSPAELNLALCLNRNWKSEYGGLIRFTRNGASCGEVEPFYGRLVVILNDPPFFLHEVTEVKTERSSALCRMSTPKNPPNPL